MKLHSIRGIEPHLYTLSRIRDKNCKKSGESYGRRVVRTYELDYITWGGGKMITDGRIDTTVKGRLFFRQPGMIVEGVGPYHCYYMTFNFFGGSDMLEKAKKSHERIDLPTYVDVEEPLVLQQQFSELYMDYVKGENLDSFIVKARLMQILLTMYKASKNASIDNESELESDQNRNIMRVIDRIQKNPVRHYTVGQLADCVGYNTQYFCRLFKRVTGVTPITYINRCRINQIKLELIETNKSIKEIIIENGFENESYFYRLFRTTTGVTPIEYRNKHGYMYL